MQLTVAVSPLNATSRRVAWTTSNENVAAVSSGGRVMGLAIGITIITATAANGVYDTAMITVLPASEIVSTTGVVVNPTSLSLQVGEDALVFAAILPSNATNRAVTWSVNNTNVALGNTTGTTNTIMALAVGTSIVTVRTVDGGYTATVTVTVTYAVVTLLSIEVVTPPTRTVYIQGETFDPAGIAVAASFSDGFVVMVSLAMLTFSPAGALTTAVTQIGISFTFAGVARTTSQPITVITQAGPPLVAPHADVVRMAGGGVWEALREPVTHRVFNATGSIVIPNVGAVQVVVGTEEGIVLLAFDISLSGNLSPGGGGGAAGTVTLTQAYSIGGPIVGPLSNTSTWVGYHNFWIGETSYGAWRPALAAWVASDAVNATATTSLRLGGRFISNNPNFSDSHVTWSGPAFTIAG